MLAATHDEDAPVDEALALAAVAEDAEERAERINCLVSEVGEIKQAKQAKCFFGNIRLTGGIGCQQMKADCTLCPKRNIASTGTLLSLWTISSFALVAQRK